MDVVEAVFIVAVRPRPVNSFNENYLMWTEERGWGASVHTCFRLNARESVDLLQEPVNV